MATTGGISGLISSLNTGATGNSSTGSTSSTGSGSSSGTNIGNIGNIGNVSSSTPQGTLASAGIGSGLNVNQLVSQLMSVAQAPVTQLSTEISGFQSTISAYGQLSAAVSTFQVSLGSLSDPTQYTSYTANSSSSSVLTASASSKATAGSYNVSVTALAAAQTLVAAGQSSETSSIGSGTSTTLSFQFGSVSTSGGSTTFTQDSSRGGGSVTIDSSNNTLQGIASSINAANMGVHATIVNDGGTNPWRLSLTSSQTGAKSNMKISVSGDATLQSLLAQDPAGTQNMTQTQAGQDASLTVNGLSIASSSNALTTAIPGVSMNLVATGSSTLAIAQNTSGISALVQSFVTAYNTLDSSVTQLTSAGASGSNSGPLAGEYTAQQVQSQLRRMMGNSMVGPDGASISLTDIGITFQKDGTLSLDSAKLNSVIASNPAKVGAVFAQNSAPSDSLVSVLAQGSNATAGKYAVNITHLATQGTLTAGSAVSLPYTVTSGSNDTLSVSIDGVGTTVTIPAGTYSTSSALAAAYQSAINGSSKLSSAGKSVSVAADSSDILTFTSASYGSSSFVSLGGAASTDVLGSNSVFTEGTDVAGTIGGFSAKGSGQNLTGLSGSSVSGVILQIQGTSTGSRGTISLSQGFANTLNTLANSFSSSSGLITQATNTLKSDINNDNAQIARLNSQLILLQQTYQAQFTALDATIASLNNMQSYLTQQLTSLSNTTSYIYGSSGG